MCSRTTARPSMRPPPSPPASPSSPTPTTPRAWPRATTRPSAPARRESERSHGAASASRLLQPRRSSEAARAELRRLAGLHQPAHVVRARVDRLATARAVPLGDGAPARTPSLQLRRHVHPLRLETARLAETPLGHREPGLLAVALDASRAARGVEAV